MSIKFPTNPFKIVGPQDYYKYEKTKFSEDYVGENFKSVGWNVYQPFRDKGIDLIISKYICPKGHTELNKNLNGEKCNVCKIDSVKILYFIQVKTRETKETKNKNGEVTKTTFGKAFRAIADDTEVSAIVGIPVQKILIIVAGIASALAGLAGALSGVDTGILPAIGFALFLKAVVGDIIGGLESYWGPMLGALLIALLENIVVFYFGGEWRDVAVYILLLVFLLLRPKGILIAK